MVAITISTALVCILLLAIIAPDDPRYGRHPMNSGYRPPPPPPYYPYPSHDEYYWREREYENRNRNWSLFVTGIVVLGIFLFMYFSK